MGMLLSKSTMPIVNWVAEVMGWLMNGIYSIGVHNLGLCIIIFTVIIYAFLTPLQVKQQKFSKMNAVMQPELQKIQKKYKGKKDQASQMKMQEETMAVYEKYGVSPTGSCLQMLIQMPIFFALYQVIINMPGYIGGIKSMFDAAVAQITSVDGFADIMSAFITDNKIRVYTWNADKVTNNQVIDVLYNLSPSQWDKLADIDQFQGFADVLNQTADKIQPLQNFLGLNIADNPWALIQSGWSSHHYLLIFAAILIPVLAWATQVLNMKLMPSASSSGSNNGNNSQMEATMKSMNLFMPLFTAFICFTFPVGIGIYWITGALLRSIQQIVINRHMKAIDIDELIAKNQEKANKKREKAGLPPQKITQQARQNVRNIEFEERAEKETQKNQPNVSETTAYYKENTEYAPGSLAAKANMVRQFDLKNSKKK